MKKQIILVLIAVVLGMNSIVWGGSVTVPHSFTSGTKAIASEVNNNFNTVATEVNDNDSRIAALEAAITALTLRVSELEAENTALKANTVLSLDGVLTMDTDINGYDRALFSGINVQIVSGSGTTDGAVNGTGNLIVGYNEPYWIRVKDSTGSHNIILGEANNYSSYGGLVAGVLNTISGRYATVSGGINNSSEGFYTSVSGGKDNTASGENATVSGGLNNLAEGIYTSVSAGRYNTASGSSATVSGGASNTASGSSATVSGGKDNSASGDWTTVSGGSGNSATGEGSTVSAGNGNIADTHYATISGGNSEDTSLHYQYLP